MKDTFDITRFWHVLCDDLRIIHRKILMTAGGGIGIFLVYILLQIFLLTPHMYKTELYMPDDPMKGTMKACFWFILFLLAIAAGTKFCDNLKTKTDRIAQLTLPATQLEKFLARWVMVVPLFFIAYVCTFECIDLLRCLIVKIAYPHCNCIHPVGLSFIFSVDRMGGLNLFGSLSALFALQSVFVLGSSIWPGRSFLPTFLWIAGYCVFMMIWCGWWDYIFMDGRTFPHDTFDNFSISEVWSITTTVVFCLVNYTVAYYRLKEIEIIQRW